MAAPRVRQGSGREMSTERYVLALDVGTSGVHAAVCALDGSVRASAMSPLQYRPLRRMGAGARSLSLSRAWHAVGRASRQALRSADVSPGQVAAVGVTGQRQGMVALDADGRDLYAGPNLDARAIRHDMHMDEALRERIYRTTGHLPGYLLAPLKLAWMRQYHPRQLAAVRSVMPLADWLLFRLTGRAVVERASAGDCGLLDITRRAPCEDLLGMMGLPQGAVPSLCAAGSVVGALTVEAGAELGVAPETPVVAGGPDAQCGLLGMGVTDVGQVGVVVGWTGAVQRVTSAPPFDARHRTWAGLHVAPGRWVSECNVGEAGYAYQWLAQCLAGRAGESAYRRLDVAGASVLPGADSVFACLGARPLEPVPTGVRPGGLTIPVPLAAGKWGRGHLARATLEGIAFAIRWGVERVEEVTGDRAGEVSVGGGLTRSMLFPQMLADVLARPVRVAPLADVSAVGAALCAAAALGAYASLDEAGRARRTLASVLGPDPTSSSEYADIYRRWRAFAKRTDSLIEVFS